MINKKLILLLLLLININVSNAETICKPVNYHPDQFGPHNFYDQKNHQVGVDGRKSESNITIVTNYHFTQDIIRLERGRTGFELYGDLDYTLRALPNHPQALDTVSRFETKRKQLKQYAKIQTAMPYSADCYFQRAFNVFGNKQPQTWMIWGLHKHRQGVYKKAIEFYERAKHGGLQSAELDYYLGLSYFKLKNYSKARVHADLAYEHGYQLPGLKLLLEGVKQ